MALSPDGRTVLSGEINGQVILWDAETGQEIYLLNGHRETITGVAFAQDNRTALSSSEDGNIIVWNLNTGDEVRHFDGIDGIISGIQVSADGQTVLACGAGEQIMLWDFVSGKLVRTLTSSYGCNRAMFTPDSHGVLTNGIALWDLDSGDVVRRYPQGTGIVLSPDGQTFFALTGNLHSPFIYQYRIDARDQLVAWTLANRYVRELTCNERTLYQLDPECEGDGIFPTRTPYPTAVPTATPAEAPVDDLADADTTLATVTPTITPHPVLAAVPGEQQGEIRVGDHQVWLYTGQAGESLTVRVNAVPEAGELDSRVVITAPDGRDLNVFNRGGGSFYDPAQSDDIEPGVITDSLVENLVLPVDGIYQIIVSGSGYRSGGAYTLMIESRPPEVATPVPGP
jgi:hypothetical protein